jgi:hypothetical protein
MNKKIMLSSIAAALLLTAACSSPSPANKPTNTAPATNTNTASKPTAPATNTNTAGSDSASSQQGKQDFTLVNETGVEINSVFISPHDVDDWEEDILGRDTLPSSERVDINFKRDEKAALWDLRVEDKEGNSIEWNNLNLLEISKVTLHYKDGKATAQTE